jgi:endonuclease G
MANGINRVGCSCQHEFDAREAVQRLAARVEELSELFTRYVADAPIERHTRNSRALTIANRMLRIVGGTRVQPGSFPECCVVGRGEGTDVEWFCSGTLIHPRAVLTAAHCAADRPNRVLLRADNTSFTSQAELLPVLRIRVHPEYVPDSTHDLCILILGRDSAVAPATICTPQELDDADTVHLVGFGYNDPNQPLGFGVKREVDVAIGSLRRTPGENLASEEQQFGFDSQTEFVAGRKGLGKDTCNGDSGGPAFVRVSSGFKLAGVTSRSTAEAGVRCGDGGIYGRPDQQLEWINRVLADAGVQRIRGGGAGPRVELTGNAVSAGARTTAANAARSASGQLLSPGADPSFLAGPLPLKLAAPTISRSATDRKSTRPSAAKGGNPSKSNKVAKTRGSKYKNATAKH